MTADEDVASVILHFDGTSWTSQFTETGLMLRGVWGAPRATCMPRASMWWSDARLLRFDGAQWSDVPGFAAGPFEELALEAIWGSSATDIFAVGSSSDGGFPHSLVFHFDGAQWRRMTVPGLLTPSLDGRVGKLPNGPVRGGAQRCRRGRA